MKLGQKKRRENVKEQGISINVLLKEHLSKISKENWKNPIMRQNYLDGFKKRKRRKKINE